MRLTVTLDEARGSLTVRVEHALAYPPEHVRQLLTAAVSGALAQPVDSDEVDQHVDGAALVPAPRPAVGDESVCPGRTASELAEVRLRWRVLRALEDGATVEQAAERFGVDPAQVDRWDDDVALDAHTDLLVEGFGRPLRREAS
jgi:hypothetical protein